MYRDLRNAAGVEFDENYLRSGTPSGCGHDERLFRWSPRTPTTGYFLATLRVALGKPITGVRPDPGVSLPPYLVVSL